MNNFQIPANLSAEGQKAAEIITAFCEENELTSSEPVFMHPNDWSDSCGQGSQLIVMHESTDASRGLSMDGAYEQNRGDYSLYNELTQRLNDGGVYIEQVYKWCSAIRVH